MARWLRGLYWILNIFIPPKDQKRQLNVKESTSEKEMTLGKYVEFPFPENLTNLDDYLWNINTQGH